MNRLIIILALLAMSLQAKAIDMQNLQNKQFVTITCYINKPKDLFHKKFWKIDSSWVKKIKLLKGEVKS